MRKTEEDEEQEIEKAALKDMFQNQVKSIPTEAPSESLPLSLALWLTLILQPFQASCARRALAWAKIRDKKKFCRKAQSFERR